jgi:hypothetical protein
MTALSMTATVLFAAAIGVISVGFGAVVGFVVVYVALGIIRDCSSALRENRRLGRALREERLRRLAEDVMES